jgi:uncharacterized membrane protein YgcG
MLIIKHKTKLRLFVPFCLILIGICYYGCRKDTKTESTANLSPTVAQAKTWYESTYPISATNSKLAVQSTGANANQSVDLSQVLKPDWAHGVTYTRFKAGVVELPLAPSAVNTVISLGHSAAIMAHYKPQYTRSSFLLINDSTGYHAYVMTLIADSTYIKNDPTKLDRDKYNKRDSDFSGFCIYSTPKGKLVSCWYYQNGQLFYSVAANPYGSGQVAQSYIGNNGKQLADLESEDCYDVSWDTYGNGELTNSEYLYTVCFESTGGSGGGGSTGGSGGGTTTGGGVGNGTTTTPCSTASGSSIITRSKSINVYGPPPGSGAPVGVASGYPPPTTTTSCDETPITGPNTIKIVFCQGLTTQEQNSITSTVAAFSTEDCASRFLYNYFGGKTISFCITPGNYNANYNPATGGFTFSTDQMATPANADLLEHEFFHDYQNATYPGGILPYGENTTTGANNPGAVNIEFEQAVFNDIATGGRSAFTQGTPEQRTDYDSWISSLTNNGTVYPQLSPGTAAYSQFITSYNSYLSEYNNIPGNAYTSSIINLTPQALINLFNIVTSPNC